MAAGAAHSHNNQGRTMLDLNGGTSGSNSGVGIALSESHYQRVKIKSLFDPPNDHGSVLGLHEDIKERHGEIVMGREDSFDVGTFNEEQLTVHSISSNPSSSLKQQSTPL